MGKQIRRLTALQLCNFCGFNEFRHSKDRKKKSRYLLMGILWIFVILILLLYMAGIDITCVVLGMPKLIPLMSATIVCLVILFFSILKAGSTIFGMKDYEMLMALPMSKQAIIISRFLTMYVNNLGLGTLVMLPGIIIYAVAVRPGVLYYIFIVLGTLLLPLLPITIATLIGAGITAISARMKHKSLISGLLTVLIGLAAVIFSMKLQTVNLDISEQDVENLETDNMNTATNGFKGKTSGISIYLTNNIHTSSSKEIIYVMTKRAIAHANQINEVKAYSPEDLFADAVKGLNVYGSKLVRPKELVALEVSAYA